MANEAKIARALISVTDKTGVVEFARSLQDTYGVEIISTGGTARALEEGGVTVVPIEEYTGFPEMMDGRVKTLHPMVHGGLLARRDSEQHMAEAAEHGIGMIDMVVVNLYEFEKTVAKPDVTFADAIEHIDIGGPSMLRSAAKNADSVTVVSDPSDYEAILAEMAEHDGATTLETRRRLQVKVYTTTAAYDGAISTWLAAQASGSADAALTADGEFAAPATMGMKLEKAQDLRYGENPQQAAAVYRFDAANAPLFSSAAPLVGAEQLQGKPRSYNNFLDAEAAWNAVREFDEPGVIILKHQNPCGSAVAGDVTEAYDRAFACDPKSAFGGIVAVNREVPLSLVEHFADRDKLFVEVLIAPSFSPEALERLAKRPNLRVLATGGASGHAKLEMRTVDGGMLVQRVDTVDEDPATFTFPTERKPTDAEMRDLMFAWKVCKTVKSNAILIAKNEMGIGMGPGTFTFPTERKPTDAEMRDLMFAWKVCKTVKSNAILIAKNEMGIGMGPGQPNRVDSALLACQRADEVCERLGQEAGGYACASDAFFPFRDNVDTLAAHGVTAIIQPGGSVRDEESIDACNEHGIAMVFTGTRHFRH